MWASFVTFLFGTINSPIINFSCLLILTLTVPKLEEERSCVKRSTVDVTVDISFLDKTCPNPALLQRARENELTSAEKSEMVRLHYAVARNTIASHCEESLRENNRWLTEINLPCRKNGAV